jgi:hypothetical protein
MQILSPPLTLLVGSNPISVPLPARFPHANAVAAFVVVKNIGAVDCTVTIGTTPGIMATANSSPVAASQAPAIPGLWRNTANLAIGSVITLDFTAGPLYISALAALSVTDTGVNQVGTASEGSTSITLGDATGVTVGMYLSGTGIPAFATVTAIVGDVITISAATTAALSNVTLDFGSAASPQPPGLLVVALGL